MKMMSMDGGPYGMAQQGPERFAKTDNYLLVQATLAVAWEARTANLIAWRDQDGRTVEELEEVDEAIRCRMGIW